MPDIFAVRRARGPAWDSTKPLDEQADWHAHAAFMDGLHERGIVLFAGPLESVSAALVIMRAARPEEAAQLLADDPWGPDMLTTTEIARWSVRIGRLA